MPDLILKGRAVHRVEGAVQGRVSGIDIGTNFASNDADILITSIGLSQSVKIAYFSTLGDSLYIYPLGNEMSKCIITGMALPATEACAGAIKEYSAVAKLLKFYEANRGSNFRNVSAPLTLVIPPTTLVGFIDGMTMEISSAANEFGFAKFSFTMAIIPNKSK